MRQVKVVNLSLIWILFLTPPLFLAALVIFRFSSSLQFYILTLAALVYLAGAFLHHLKDKTLTLEIMVEYILIAVLALLILQGLII